MLIDQEAAELEGGGYLDLRLSENGVLVKGHAYNIINIMLS